MSSTLLKINKGRGKLLADLAIGEWFIREDVLYRKIDLVRSQFTSEKYNAISAQSGELGFFDDNTRIRAVAVVELNAFEL